jgi:hypothetical protein
MDFSQQMNPGPKGGILEMSSLFRQPAAVQNPAMLEHYGRIARSARTGNIVPGRPDVEQNYFLMLRSQQITLEAM